jgi:uncharacterized membrane protein YfcA
MEWTFFSFILASLAICLGSILQAVTGLGAGLVIAPLLALISYELIPAPIIFASLSLTVVMTYKGWNYIDFKSMKNLLPGLLLGIIIAANIITYLPLAKLGIVFGMLILVAVVISVMAANTKPNQRWYPAIGALSGFMGTTAAIGAPVLALLYQNQSGATIRATLACLYLFSSVPMLLSLHFVGKFGVPQLLSGLYLMPAFLLGFFIAPLFISWLDRGYARHAVLIFSSVSAVSLIIKSI